MAKQKYTDIEIINIIEADIKEKYKDLLNNESIAILILINSIAYYCTYRDTYINLLNNKYNLNLNDDDFQIIEEICHEHLMDELNINNNLNIQHLKNVLNDIDNDDI